jgi:hypothetical protein
VGKIIFCSRVFPRIIQFNSRFFLLIMRFNQFLLFVGLIVVVDEDEGHEEGEK